MNRSRSATKQRTTVACLLTKMHFVEILSINFVYLVSYSFMTTSRENLTATCSLPHHTFWSHYFGVMRHYQKSQCHRYFFSLLITSYQLHYYYYTFQLQWSNGTSSMTRNYFVRQRSRFVQMLELKYTFVSSFSLF